MDVCNLFIAQTFCMGHFKFSQVFFLIKNATSLSFPYPFPTQQLYSNVIYFTRAIFDSTLSAASQPDRSSHDDLSGSIDLTVSKRKNAQKMTVHSINKRINLFEMSLLCGTQCSPCLCVEKNRCFSTKTQRAQSFTEH